jgi:hypothetical protein
MMLDADLVTAPVPAESMTLLLCFAVLLIATMPILALIAFCVILVLLTAVSALEAGAGVEGCTAPLA